MKFLKALLLKASGKISKEKVTALVVALLTALQSLDLIHLTVEDMTTIAGVIGLAGAPRGGWPSRRIVSPALVTISTAHCS